MKRLAFLLLWFASGVSAMPAIDCKPSTFGGTGSKLVVEADPLTGYSIGWLCPNPDGTWRLWQFWGHWSDIVRGTDEKRALDAAGSAGVANLNALTTPLPESAKNATGQYLYPPDLDMVVQTVFANTKALLPAPPPAGSTWKVKPNGNATTRVVYAYNAATNSRGAVTSATAAIGSSCDPTIKVTESLGALVTTYMGVPGGIAVCSLQ